MVMERGSVKEEDEKLGAWIKGIGVSSKHDS